MSDAEKGVQEKVAAGVLCLNCAQLPIDVAAFYGDKGALLVFKEHRLGRCDHLHRIDLDVTSLCIGRGILAPWLFLKPSVLQFSCGRELFS